MIFQFSAVKEYLRSYIEQLPKQGWGEVQRWANHLGVQASFVSQILSGAKSLNVDQALKLSSVLGLQESELDYFILLVEQERAGNHATKEYFAHKVQALKKESRSLHKRLQKDRALTDEEQSIFYSSWLYSATRMHCSLPGGRSLAELSETLKLSREETGKILAFLCETGLCQKKGNHYVVGFQKTHLEKSSPHIRKHWSNWHVKALGRMDDVQEHELIYSAPFTISEKDFDLFKEEITALLQKLVTRVEKTKPEKVALLNIDFLELKT
jgi:uncharacterized protein (TIGR02147 family)